MSAVRFDAGTISGETAARSSTALTIVASLGGSADGEATAVVGGKAETNDGEAPASSMSLMTRFDSCHRSSSDKEAEGSDSLSAAELFQESVLSGAVPLAIGAGVCKLETAVSSNGPDGGGTIFLETTKTKAVAGNAGRIWGPVSIFFRITNGRVEKPLSDIERTSPENRVVSAV